MNFNEEDVIKEANRCLNCKNPMCKKGCPINNDIPEFISKVKENKFDEAFYIDSNKNPLGAICGLICPHEKQCEGSCVRRLSGGSIKIGMIENYISERYILNNQNEIENSKKESNSEVAIIGGGPAGISLAYHLAKNNISSTIFEKENNLGGIMKYEIPDFRLNKNLLDKVIKFATSSEFINVKYNMQLINKAEYEKIKNKDGYFTLDELKKNGYKYIFISTGAELSKSLEIESINSKYIIGANEFLRDNLKYDMKNKKCIVIGGGNVAIDSSRVAKKNEADVTIVYRRLKENMPANVQEIRLAEDEKINFAFQKNVIKVEEINDNYNLKLYLDDGDIIYTDYLIFAIGAKVNNKVLDEEIILENGLIKVDENFETSVKNIYAGGDAAFNKSTIANAISNGMKVANKITEKMNIK